MIVTLSNPFLHEPTAPNLADYKHMTPNASIITARGSTESVAGDDEPGPASQSKHLSVGFRLRYHSG